LLAGTGGLLCAGGRSLADAKARGGTLAGLGIEAFTSTARRASPELVPSGGAWLPIAGGAMPIAV